MAQGFQTTILDNKEVKSHLCTQLEINQQFTNSLYELNLISIEEKNVIDNLQRRRRKQAEKCLEYLRNSQIPTAMEDFCTALNKNRLGHIVQFLKTSDFNIGKAMFAKLGNTDKLPKHGNTVKIPNVTAIEINTPNSEAEHRLIQHDNNVLNSLIRSQNSAVSLYHIQHGCIEIFIHSNEGPSYDTVSSEAFCVHITQQLFQLENVQKSLRAGQKVTIVVKRDPFSLPLLDEAGNKLKQFSKKQAMLIHNAFFKKNVDNIFAALFENSNHATSRKMTENVGREKSFNELELFELLEKELSDANGTKSNFMSLMKNGYYVEIEDILTKMSCLECYRKSVLSDFDTVMDEIDTDIMEKTFEGKKYIPDVVKDDCILSKGKRSRTERAKCFLEYVLIKGDVLVRFAEVFASLTNAVIKFSPCTLHDEAKTEINSETVKEIKYSMIVCVDETGKFHLENVCDDDNVENSVDARPATNGKEEGTITTDSVIISPLPDVSQNATTKLHIEDLSKTLMF